MRTKKRIFRLVIGVYLIIFIERGFIVAFFLFLFTNFTFADGDFRRMGIDFYFNLCYSIYIIKD